MIVEIGRIFENTELEKNINGKKKKTRQYKKQSIAKQNSGLSWAIVLKVNTRIGWKLSYSDYWGSLWFPLILLARS